MMFRRTAKGLPVPEDAGLIRGTCGDEAANAPGVLKEEAENMAREQKDPE